MQFAFKEKVNRESSLLSTAIPWCKHWGRFCARRPLGPGLPLCPGSNSGQTQRGHWGIAPTCPPRPCTPAEPLCQCEAWGRREEGGKDRIELKNNFEVQNDEGTWVTYLALSMASVRCTLLSWPKQNLSPPEGSTYPSTVTMGQEEGTLNVSPTWTSISK